MVIAYITYSAPFGFAESFVAREMVAIENLGPQVVAIPLCPRGTLVHGDDHAPRHIVRVPLLSFSILMECLRAGLMRPRAIGRALGDLVWNSASWHVLIRNLVIFPKAVWIAEYCGRTGVSRIHSHWATVPTTAAYIVSQLTGIPFSFTTHRWDLYENNMLAEKVRKAQFVRCISERGRRDLLEVCDREAQGRVAVVNNGSVIPPRGDPPLSAPHVSGNHFAFCMPANLIPIKGHQYVIEACRLLRERGVLGFDLVCFGDGPLHQELVRQVERAGLSRWVTLPGGIPHGALIRKYEDKTVGAVLLPSLDLGNHEHEGVPYALIEAMAYSVPVITTPTGSIPELVAADAGLLVPQRSAEAIADAMVTVMTGGPRMTAMVNRAHEVVQEHFNLAKNAEVLLSLISLDGGNTIAPLLRR